MGDGASSSSRGRGETVVVDHGRRRSSCGYCRSTGSTSICHGLWAYSVTVDDYQELLDHGWRRSGSFLYKPEMEKTCCPSYTIRLKVGDFVPSKEQVRVHKKMQRFLCGTIDMKNPDQIKDKPSSSKGLFSLANIASATTVSELSSKESSAGKCEKACKEDEYINYLSNKIDDAIGSCVGSGEFPSTVQLPKAVVKKVTPQAKKRLMEISDDLLYTSSISFQIAAALRHWRSTEKKADQLGLSSNCGNQNGESLDLSPNIVAEKLACTMEQQWETSGLSVKACNGHLNFYSATKQSGSMPVTAGASTQSSTDNGGNPKRSCSTDKSAVLPQKRRKLEIRMKRSTFDPEEYALYRRYQIKVHNDEPERVTEGSYRRFLVDTPIIFVPPRSNSKTVPPCGFGSFHQQYLIDGKLVAVGVVDILPRCLSSKYLFWDPDLAFLSLGKYSALQEIDWVKETQVHCPSLQYYYLGYYIHSCSKMRYKAVYHPSELLCPLRYQWVPFDIVRPLLDKKSYVILSDYTAIQDGASSPSQVPGSSIRQSCLGPDNDGPSEDCSDEDEEMELEFEGSDRGIDDELVPETSCAPLTDDLLAGDISNVVIDLNGSRVKFKDLQQVFGPIEKRSLSLLELQLQRYVKAVGKELSGRMVYTLG